MTDPRPDPGTLAYHSPEPELVTQVRRLVSDGVSRDEAAASLARPVGTDRGTLEEAHVYWVWQMHRLSSDDYDATRVLMILEEALRHMSPASSRPDGRR